MSGTRVLVDNNILIQAGDSLYQGQLIVRTDSNQQFILQTKNVGNDSFLTKALKILETKRDSKNKYQLFFDTLVYQTHSSLTLVGYIRSILAVLWALIPIIPILDKLSANTLIIFLIISAGLLVNWSKLNIV